MANRTWWQGRAATLSWLVALVAGLIVAAAYPAAANSGGGSKTPAVAVAPHYKVAGHANVLIFPDLNSGNIASKLVQHVGRAHAYGQVLLGLDRPAADVSRGSTTHDILGVAAIVGVQSISYDQLYPQSGQRLPGER